jgi:hypothetical protein
MKRQRGVLVDIRDDEFAVRRRERDGMVDPGRYERDAVAWRG